MTTCPTEEIFTGDTVRIKATFRAYAVPPAIGALADPDGDDTTWTLYDVDKNLIDTGAGEKESVGIYFYDLTASDSEGTYYFEFSGEFDSKPQLKRVKLVFKFKPGS